MRQPVRILGLRPLGIHRQPHRGIKEDRLGAHIRGRPPMLQQQQAGLEATLRVVVDYGPAVDHGERAQAPGRAPRDVEPDQPAQRVAHEVTGLGLRLVEDAQHFVRHGMDAVILGQLAPGPAGACLVVGDHAIARGERRELRRPIARRAAQPGREQHGLGAGACIVVNVEGHVVPCPYFLPICAVVAISTSASFFTRPHWMQ